MHQVGQLLRSPFQVWVKFGECIKLLEVNKNATLQVAVLYGLFVAGIQNGANMVQWNL